MGFLAAAVFLLIPIGVAASITPESSNDKTKSTL
jgi:hypothetical protein